MAFALGAGKESATAQVPAQYKKNLSAVGSQRRFGFPAGGCTDAGIALFDRGPMGKDPFRLFV